MRNSTLIYLIAVQLIVHGQETGIGIAKKSDYTPNSLQTPYKIKEPTPMVTGAPKQDLLPIPEDDFGAYIVKSKSLNIRSMPSINANIVGVINYGEVVEVIDTNNSDWWHIKYRDIEGYAFSKNLHEVINADKYKDWEKVKMATGDKPECENIDPRYDYDLDNELLIHVSNHSDAVVKMINYNSDVCIRIAYIKAGDSYSMKNIPEGIYYLKIAYGSDFRKYNRNGQCIVKFVKDAIYKKGTDKLDYYKVKKPNTIEGDYEYEHWSLPSFEISLNTYSVGNDKALNSNEISNEEFNH